MSNSTSCPYDLGAPAGWVSNASIPTDAKACAVPIDQRCGNNTDIIDSCCNNATNSLGVSAEPATWENASIRVCSLPDSASNETFQAYQDCILNAPGRTGGFRCNVPDTLNRSPYCNSLSGSIPSPISVPENQQVCVTGAQANTSDLMDRCCGSPAVAFEGGCWQYCISPVGPPYESVGGCIQQGLRAMNYPGNVGCEANSGTPVSSGASSLSTIAAGSNLGLVAILAYVAGIL